MPWRASPKNPGSRRCNRRQQATGKNQVQLASEAGVTPSFVSMLMIFDQLPEEMTSVLDKRPELIGANAAEEFAKLIKRGRRTQVMEAVKAIAEDGMSQAAALRLASRDEQAAPVPVASKKIRSGKSVFAELRGADKVLRISFRSQEDRLSAEDAIAEVLARFAARAK